MRRAVPVVLLAVAVLQIGTLSAVVGTVVRGEAPAPASAAHLPPSGALARVDLDASPRRAEFVDVPHPGSASPIRTWVVYPERLRAPTVMIVHVAPAVPAAGPPPLAAPPGLYALSDWVRSIARALAAEGFIAVAPDLLASVTPGGSFPLPHGRPHERTSWLSAIRAWALDLPAANGQVGVVGFSWSGSAGFAYPVDQPELDALVVFHGNAPAAETDYGRINAPVLGLYGGDLQTTVDDVATSTAAAAGKFEVIVYGGATVFLNPAGRRRFDGALVVGADRAVASDGRVADPRPSRRGAGRRPSSGPVSMDRAHRQQSRQDRGGSWR